jgi:hypothetical protein
MPYHKPSRKVRDVIQQSLPLDKKPLLTSGQIDKLQSAAQIALAVLMLGGTLTLTAVAPNVFVAIDKLFLRKHPGRRLSRSEREQRTTRAFYYLKERGYIKIFLTKLGRKKIQELDYQAMQVPRPGRWNGKWWQVAADIPTAEHKRDADIFRDKLRAMGFFPLQRTLWFYPYDPREQVETVAERCGIENFVTVMEVSRLDSDDEAKMRDFFEAGSILSKRIG